MTTNSHRSRRELATAFCTALRKHLTEQEMAQVVERNRASLHPGVCATHDFFDANEAMLDAFRTCYGRPPHFPCDVGAEGTTQEQADNDTHLVNDAWDLAKAADFDLDRIQSVDDDSVLSAATHAALDAGCLMIQNHLGVQTGDFAAMHFSGLLTDRIKEIFRDYLEAERSAQAYD